MPGCIQPMSSPMMNRMFGLDCCCANAGKAIAVAAAARPTRPLRRTRMQCMACASWLKRHWFTDCHARYGPVMGSMRRAYGCGSIQLRLRNLACTRPQCGAVFRLAPMLAIQLRNLRTPKYEPLWNHFRMRSSDRLDDAKSKTGILRIISGNRRRSDLGARSHTGWQFVSQSLLQDPAG